MKISVGIIARNSATTLRKCLESLLWADEIVVGLAGESTDSTPSIAFGFAQSYAEARRQFPDAHAPKVMVYDIPWTDDFSAARNTVWGQLTGDVAVWVDADDEVLGGEYVCKYFEANPKVNCIYAEYLYQHDDHGNVITRLWRERAVRNPSEWHWQDPVHETLNLDPAVPLTPLFVEEFKVLHQLDRPKDKGDRNLRMLYDWLSKAEPDPPMRLLMYLGRENHNRGFHTDAVRYWTRYLAIAQKRAQAGEKPNDEWGQTAHDLASAYRALGDLAKAEVSDLMASHWAPDHPWGVFGLAESAYLRQDWPNVVRFIQAGAALDAPRTGLIVNDLEYTYRPQYMLGAAYAHLGDHQTALENLRKAADLLPDPDLLTYMRVLAGEMEAQGVLRAFMLVYAYLARNDEWLKVRRLFSVAPKILETHPDITAAKMLTMAQTAHMDNPELAKALYSNYTAWAPIDDAVLLSPEWAAQPRVAWAKKVLCDPPKYILDLGSADGIISLPLALDGHRVDGYNLDPRAVEVANRRAAEWGLNNPSDKAERHKNGGSAFYHVGGIDDLVPEERWDVALAFEIIEHLPDPAAFLDQLDTHANKIALTTPYLAWENGRIPTEKWQAPELKEHVRIFDLMDVESLIGHRGRVIDLYREPAPSGDSAWIFASYKPGEQYAGSVTFLAPGTLEEWSPRKFREQGLGGSETALIRLAEELAARHNLLVTTFGRIDSLGYHNGVRYRRSENFIPEIHQDAFVAWRYPEAADLPIEGRMVLWAHDATFGDRLTPERMLRFDKLVLLTEWHKQTFLEQYPWLDQFDDRIVIVGNGVDLERFTTKPAPKREAKRVMFASSPDRGLDHILEYIWPRVTERVPDAELHIYYGWQNFDILRPTHPNLAALQDRIGRLMLNNKNVIQHGRVNQEVLAQEWRKASIWLYPTEWPETYCITAIEAQLAGAIPIVNTPAALSETVAGGVIIKGQMTDSSVLDQYVEAVVTVLTAPQAKLDKERRKIRRQAPAVSWEKVSDRWLEILKPPD